MSGPAAPTPTADGARGPALLGLVLPTPAGLRLEGRSLAEHAVEALRTVRGVEVRVLGGGVAGAPGLDPAAAWVQLAAGGLVLHDSHCPLLPGSALREAVQLVCEVGSTSAVVGVRPVTDTIKEVVEGTVVGTIDRDSLSALASPVVVGAGLVAALAQQLHLAGQLADLTAVVAALSRLGRLVAHEIPSAGRRLSDPDDVVLMECLHGLHRTLRQR